MKNFIKAKLVTIFCATAAFAQAQVLNPELPSDPLNKIFFGARVFPHTGPIRSMQIEVDTVKECLAQAAQALDRDPDFFKDARAVEVRCIRERNSEKPS